METALRMTASYPRIPYGEMSFPRIRRNGWLYVDKTRYLRPLEDERYVFFIRPRRFGKSCWLALLECYYGRHWAHEFEGLFGGTDVGRAPTAERGRYVVVRFDFSAFDDKLVNRRVSAGARQLNGNFDLLRHLIGEGETEADLSLSFPLDELDEPENFLSLLYYFGLLSIRGVSGGTTRLGSRTRRCGA